MAWVGWNVHLQQSKGMKAIKKNILNYICLWLIWFDITVFRIDVKDEAWDARQRQMSKGKKQVLPDEVIAPLSTVSTGKGEKGKTALHHAL